ncbi:MAG: molecular chaperone [Candidatus Kapaibacteriota bacterium]
MTAFYCEPDVDLFCNNKFLELFLKTSKDLDEELYSYAVEIFNYLRNASELELMQEYSKTFLGPFGVVAHPYASVYLENYTLNGKSTQKILNFYNECGLLFDENVRDLPDNVVVVLQFLHYLLYSENFGNDEYPNIDWGAKRKEFLNLYVKSWSPQFTEKIKSITNNKLYKNLALMTEKFFEIL